MRPWPLRWRVAAWFTGGLAVLLCAGAVVMVGRLERGVRADFDRDLEHTARAARALFAHDLAEFRGDARAAAVHIMGELVFGDRRIAVVDAEDRVLASSTALEGTSPPAIELAPPGLPLNEVTTVRLPDGPARVLHLHLQDGLGLVIGASLAPLEARLHLLQLSLALGLPLLLLGGAVAGVLGTRAALRPVTAVAEAAERAGDAVAAGEAEFPRLPEPAADDEVRQLTRAYNRLAERLEAALARERGLAERQRRFLADAAHELRTPVAILRSEAEGALAAPRDAAADQASLRHMAQEATRLGALVGDLLLLARTDQPAAPAPARVFLDDLAQQAMARARRLPEAAGRQVVVGAFEEAPVEADAGLVERAIFALLENALVHGAGTVEVSAGRDGGLAWLRVRDHGRGIPAGEAERVFERFTRLDLDTPGTGLGLAIARHVAERHGGTVRLEAPSGGGSGAQFVLRLPSARVTAGRA
ncbi:MAG: HAMP domain-containing sensor histidine kinase [Gemmatimonadales bacterium]|nr:HAMP domain-containing sensor histidine kinase [Gemmatimonadales bacterium]